MSGAAMKCLNTSQLVFGVDWHLSFPPLKPVLAPHAVIWVVGWSQKTNFLWAVTTSKASSPESGVSTPVVVDGGYAIAIDHDAGPHPVHLFPNLLYPIITIGSSSKAKFASGTVITPQGPMAIAVAYWLNFNLNCQDFPLPPLPTGVTVAAFCKVRAGFTLGDLFRGLGAMAIDMAIQWLIGAITAVTFGAVRGARGWFMSAIHGSAKWSVFKVGFGRSLSSSFRPGFLAGLSPRGLSRAVGNLFQGSARALKSGTLSAIHGQGFRGAFKTGWGRAMTNGAAKTSALSVSSSVTVFGNTVKGMFSATAGRNTIISPLGFEYLKGLVSTSNNIWGIGSPMGLSSDTSLYSRVNPTDWVMNLGRSMTDIPGSGAD
ncbi:hypothetical protein [Enhygromyxa salina]|uniref:Uncharacterized protein n=1 Tax=Enhygromyxa salina TaxID=215803 RepID=A0A2S9YXE1_9BACT|nr:hypothetical protein [Enhygromyxa salina]PRQ09744.1 hypothetical protein ENSA7_04990 [Enhygromyxa salina]